MNASSFSGAVRDRKAGGKSAVAYLPVRHEQSQCFIAPAGAAFRNPAALESEQYLTGTSGTTLDPVFALGGEIELDPQASDEIAYLTFTGDSRETVLALAGRYSRWSLVEQSFHQANIAAQSWLGKQNSDSQVFNNSLQILSALVYPFKALRTSRKFSFRQPAQPVWIVAVWDFGDYPILLVEIEDPKQVDLIREVLQVYEYLRSRHFMADVVIPNYQHTDYGGELNGLIFRLIGRLDCEQFLNQRGGIFILAVDQINPDERILLQASARYVFTGKHGSLADQMQEFPIQVHHLPEFIPSRSTESPITPLAGNTLPAIEPLQFFNGYGGFSSDGREYIIELPPGRTTPAPWVNIIGYPNFGFMVSETGSQCTWAANSAENRLTPWSNDPVSDPSGEALYLRDETGEFWTPTPLPVSGDQPYRVTHGAGYTTFDHNSHGLRQRLTIFASPEDPVKIIHLQVENT